MLPTVALVLTGYLLGSLPIAALVAGRTGHDPTVEGSGNPGASNVYRTVGRRAASVVLVGDLAKGAVAAALGWALAGHLVGLAAGTAAVLGHVVPLGRPRRGGKGVATAAGVVLVLYPIHGSVALVAWAVLARGTRRASVASLLVAVGLPASIAASGVPAGEALLLAALAVLVVARHAGNIGRLRRGEERPLGTGPR